MSAGVRMDGWAGGTGEAPLFLLSKLFTSLVHFSGNAFEATVIGFTLLVYCEEPERFFFF